MVKPPSGSGVKITLYCMSSSLQGLEFLTGEPGAPQDRAQGSLREVVTRMGCNGD